MVASSWASEAYVESWTLPVRGRSHTRSTGHPSSEMVGPPYEQSSITAGSWKESSAGRAIFLRPISFLRKMKNSLVEECSWILQPICVNFYRKNFPTGCRWILYLSPSIFGCTTGNLAFDSSGSLLEILLQRTTYITFLVQTGGDKLLLSVPHHMAVMINGTSDETDHHRQFILRTSGWKLK